MNAEEGRAVIGAANANGVQLMIGYRLQHEPDNRRVMRYAEEETYGAVQTVETGGGYNGAHPDPDDWRRDAQLAGLTGQPDRPPSSERSDKEGTSPNRRCATLR